MPDGNDVHAPPGDGEGARVGAVRVAFYLENSDLRGVSLAHPDQGNPGCGGTHYLFAAIPFYLAKIPASSVDPVLIVTTPGGLPNNVECHVAADLMAAVGVAKANDCEMLVYKPAQSDLGQFDRLARELERQDMEAIAWLHLTPRSAILRAMAANPRVRALLAVEQDQQNRLADHPAGPKCIVVQNAVPLRDLNEVAVNYGGRTVVYMGSLVPQKGFERLARVWPRLLRKFPDARLLVIGSGQLYKSDAQLGRWGVAGEPFETKGIRAHLAGADGEPDPSVHFVGKIGGDKSAYLRQARVGVANPVGSTETFCISAVEFQAAGLPVVAGDQGGLRDTVVDGRTGYLVRSADQLYERLCTLLSDEGLAYSMGQAARLYVNKRYEIEDVAHRWAAMICHLRRGSDLPHDETTRAERRNPSGLTRINAAFRSGLSLPSAWPSVLDGIEALQRSRRLVRRLSKRLRR